MQSLPSIPPPSPSPSPSDPEEQLERKRQLKAVFDAEYDEGEGAGHLEELRREAGRQAELNRAELEGMSEPVRQQFEGYRPGSYVRVEVKGQTSGPIPRENGGWSLCPVSYSILLLTK